jgi:hypothetical protein
MADPRSISPKDITAVAKSTVAKVLERHQGNFPKPNYRFGFFPPWWIGIVLTNPNLGKVNLAEAGKLAADLGQGVGSAVSALKGGGKPGVLLGDGHLTIGYAPPIDFLVE